MFALVWAAFICIKLPTFVLGLFVVPFLYRYRATQYRDLPWWTKPWANPEDWTGGPMGVDGYSLPMWWIVREGEGFLPFYHYHAIRNPANGLRSFEFLDLDIDKEKVRYVTPEYFTYYEPWNIRHLPGAPRTVWYLAWQGWKAGLKFVHLWSDDRHFVFKFGWRVEPRDAHDPVNPNGQRVKGAGFATKLLPYRKG